MWVLYCMTQKLGVSYIQIKLCMHINILDHPIPILLQNTKQLRTGRICRIWPCILPYFYHATYFLEQRITIPSVQIFLSPKPGKQWQKSCFRPESLQSSAYFIHNCTPRHVSFKLVWNLKLNSFLQFNLKYYANFSKQSRPRCFSKRRMQTFQD